VGVGGLRGGTLVAGLSVRKAGKKLKIQYTTAFRWRHRWLQRLRGLKGGQFNEIVEAHKVSAELSRVRRVPDRHSEDIPPDRMLAMAIG
jgi:hypothetical protein